MLKPTDEKIFTHNHCGMFPPEKPRYTMTEEVQHTTRRMEEVIDRLLKFEERVKNDMYDLSRSLTSDNCIFKDTMNTAYLTFLQEVKNEVNLFESNVENTISLFQKDIESNYSTLDERVFEKVAELETKYDEDFATFKTSIQEQYNSLAENVNSRIDSNNTTFGQAFADYQQKLTTEINMFEASVNNANVNFTESVNNTIQVFKETWEQIITERLNSQDAKIDDCELYMKTNLTTTITTLIGDMKTNGEFVDILEGEVLNHLESRIERIVTPEMFGAVADGLADDTEAIENCLMSGNIVVLKGIYKISRCLDFNNLSNIVLFGGKIVREKDKTFNTIQGENCENIHIISVEFDGNGNNKDLTYNWSEEIQGCIILCGNTSNIFIEKCTIKNFNYGVYTLGANFEGGYLSKNATIKDCYFENVSSPVDTYGKGILISHNIFKDITGNAIQIEAEGTIKNSNPLEDTDFYQSAFSCRISDNVLININGTCVIIHDNVYGVKIDNNTMTNFDYGINACRTIKGCFVENNTLIHQNEIEVNTEKRPWDLSYFTIYCGKNSHIKDNYIEGAYVGIMGREGSIISGNEIVNPKVSGIVISSSDETLIHFITDNIIKDFVKNSNAWYDSKPIVLNNGKSLIIDNIVYADCEPIATINATANIINLVSTIAQTTEVSKLTNNSYSN